MPQDYQTIFETLTQKMARNRSNIQKCFSRTKSANCFNKCKESDSFSASDSLSKEFPDPTSTYLCLDFNVVGYGYKLMHKIFEAAEYKKYQTKYQELQE